MRWRAVSISHLEISAAVFDCHLIGVCVQESVCCHSQLVSATSLTCNAQGPIALRCIALFIPERRPVKIIVPSLSFLQITWLFIKVKLFVCLLRRPFLCEAILACEVSSWRIL